jgi:hypothetical protein
MPDPPLSPLKAATLAPLLLCGALLVVACGSSPLGMDDPPACPPGVGRGLWDLSPFADGERGPRGPEARLLENPNFGATPQAAGDLRDGTVDRRLVAALAAVAGERRICVDAIKEGHYFLPGVPDGPRIPEGYGEAGGLPNTHYFGRAADIRWIDGEPVRGNGASEAVQDVGRVLAGMPPQRRPDQIIGPQSWAEALAYPREAGWILDRDQLELHEDHIHIGYFEEEGTRNAR